LPENDIKQLFNQTTHQQEHMQTAHVLSTYTQLILASQTSLFGQY